ncbi:MAG: SDR family NAD(P)-dependent oxidoreductase [Pseudomonadota bacterium]
MSAPLALIVGVGDGLSASLARLLTREGYRVALAARNIDKLAELAQETGARTYSCDAANPDAVADLFAGLDGSPNVVVYNPSARVRGPITELDPQAVHNAIDITAYGAFLVGQQAARGMLAAGEGTILFTGASAGVKGFPHSATFAMGKFAQRGLAESMARELHPQNVHVAWINIDGGIRNPGRTEAPDRPDSMLDPDAIAQTYLDLIRQHRSAWSSEVSVRPWVERF